MPFRRRQIYGEKKEMSTTDQIRRSAIAFNIVGYLAVWIFDTEAQSFCVAN